VARYLDSTKGTVSQSIKHLEDKRLVTKKPDPEDRRIVRLRLTGRGRRLVERINEETVLGEAIASIGPGHRRALQTSSVELLRAAQALNGNRSFGECHSCRFFRRLPDGSYQCGVTGEALSREDSAQLCVEHEYAA